MLKLRHQWNKRRFGNVDEEILGEINKVKDIKWPDYEEEHEEQGNKLRYKKIKDIKRSAKRVSEIFTNGIDEMVGNCEYEWHHKPDELIKKAQSGDWNFYGCYFDDKLISVESMYIIRGQRIMQWVWGCVDPAYRKMGVWKYMGKYTDKVVELSGAQMGLVWVVTSHKMSQMTAEAAGYRPIGCFVGGEFFGGSDGRYYRQNVIWYGKLYGEATKRVQNWNDMILTERAEKLVKTVKELWTNE